MKLKKVLAKALVKAQSEEPDYEDVSTLRCLTDEKDQRIIQKLYKDKCSEDDFSAYPAALAEIDKVLHKYCKKKKKSDDEKENDVDEE